MLLPASSFLLRASTPPVDALRDAGAALAVATDFNPGTSPVSSMPEAIAFACSSYGLTPLEALTAATANPAFVLGMGDRLGTLEVGKRADVLLLEEASVRAGAVPARSRPRGRDDRRRGARRMIVWLNGPFGVGKTSVARALLEAKPDWSLLDPEVRGEELVRQWPGVDDFQDLPEWRKAVVEDAVERAGTGDLVIPMTIWRLEYYREIMDGLKGATEVRPFRLTASEATMIERIERDLIEPGAVKWRLERLEEGIQAFQDTAFGDHVGTDGRTPEKIAHLILVTLGRA